MKYNFNKNGYKNRKLKKIEVIFMFLKRFVKSCIESLMTSIGTFSKIFEIMSNYNINKNMKLSWCLINENYVCVQVFKTFQNVKWLKILKHI